VLAVDLPAILNGRKQLDRLVLELDTAKSRLEKAREEEQSNSAGTFIFMVSDTYQFFLKI